MGEIHNLQLVISQSQLLNRINEGRQNATVANGAQVLNLVEKEKSAKKLSTVRELEESEKTEREEARKRRIKKGAADHLIDLYG